MVRAEPAIGHVNDRHIEKSKYRKRGRQNRGGSGCRRAPHHQIAHVQQPQHERGVEAHVPRRPPDTPGIARPDWPGDEHHGAEDYAHFSRGGGQRIGFCAALPQVINGREKIAEKQREGDRGRRHVDIKNPLHVAHGFFSGRDDESLVSSVRQEGTAKSGKREKQFGFHSAFNTVSKSRKHAVVKITQNPARNCNCTAGEPSPLSTWVVPVTMLMTAGSEMGSRSSGSISSRLRVRMDIAAKKVPSTTSAHVPKMATSSSCHRGPTVLKL